jgi:C1A family cysteine protease
VNHAVQVVGYSVINNYYIIKNSWNHSWGMNGYGYIDMDDDCLINRHVYVLKKA